MEGNKIHRNKPTTKSKVRSIRFDLDLVEYIYQQPNISKFINELIRKEKGESIIHNHEKRNENSQEICRT
ncbi:hypothetical protein AAE250_12310 [Bacteroides sp. GD17]|jgi:hypothetical protein|uniref:hypothetical protein n=1 Tax=Bacteroides sp. GD17 TaxID=3139826 RepID=UPI00313EAA4C